MLIDSEIETLMDQMHLAIQTADFTALGALSTELEAALSALPDRLDSASLLRLRHKAERNANGAQAASRGVRAALRRLDEVKQNANGLVTYDENGRRMTQALSGDLSRRF